MNAPDTGSPEPAMLLKAMVQRALQRLTPRRRAILVLYEFEAALAVPS